MSRHLPAILGRELIRALRRAGFVVLRQKGSHMSLGRRSVASVNLRIGVEREEDGRRLTEVPGLPGVMAYGQTREEAIVRVKALALRVLADG